jgi:hypothetical protein
MLDSSSATSGDTSSGVITSGNGIVDVVVGAGARGCVLVVVLLVEGTTVVLVLVVAWAVLVGAIVLAIVVEG